VTLGTRWPASVDARVQAHGAPVEVEKEGPERGKYQHPGLYGQPADTRMDREAPRPEHPARPHTDARLQPAGH
jgi:hypothetical protein